MGFQYSTILKFLAVFHGIVLSLRTLKRRLATYGFSRRTSVSTTSVDNAIQHELEGAGRLVIIK
jgi:hypothetical protein